MRKIFIFIILFFFSPLCFAMSDSEYLSVLENNLFGLHYDRDTVAVRLKRIENNVYGKSVAGSEQSRILKLKKNYPYPVSEINLNQSYSVPKTETYSSYPALEKLEMKVFGKSFSDENIYSRLDKLEMQVFQMKYSDELNNRVTRLSEKILGINTESRIATDADNIQSGSDIMQMINQLEMQSFKRTFDGDTIDSRISRLENFVFSEPFPDASPRERLDRLSTVMEAQKSSGLYDDNAANQLSAQNAPLTISAMILLLLKIFLGI